MVNKIIGAIFLMAAIALGIYVVQDDLHRKDSWENASPAKRISMMIEDDFTKLQNAKELPPEWKSVSKISYRFESSLTKTLMNGEFPNLKTSQPEKGKNKAQPKATAPETKEPSLTENKDHELEVDVLDVPDEENPGFILQMSLLESKSKNKIFELGRTYHWSTLNLKILDEKKPD